MSKLDTLQLRINLNYMITKFHNHWTKLRWIWAILRKTCLCTQTEVLRQILQTQQQIAQQMQQRPPMGANHDGPQMVTTYSQFIGMKPPTFTKAEEPLDVDTWVRAIEAKFSAFVLPCSEVHKASFAALQLC
jgi:hypothetical protein